MKKTIEAVKYMISVWDEVQGNWRTSPDHVQSAFLEAEAEIKTTNEAAAEYSQAPPVAGYKSPEKKLRERLEASQAPEEEVIQIHAVMNFWFAQRNIAPYQLMKKVFKGFCDDAMTEHIEGLYSESNFKLDGLIRSLSEDYRGHLIKYIMQNYKGITCDNVERYYLYKNRKE